MFSSSLQSSKADRGMLITPDGSVTLRSNAPENAWLPMAVMPAAIVTSPCFPAGNAISVLPSVESRSPAALEYRPFPDSTAKEPRLEHWPKASLPIDVTVAGIVMLVRLVQFQNAWSPMLMRPDGSMIFVSFEPVANA